MITPTRLKTVRPAINAVGIKPRTRTKRWMGLTITKSRDGKKVLSLLAYLMLTPAIALADPDLKIQMVAERQITVIEDGQEVVKRVPTLEIETGAVLYFTLRIVNEGDDPAFNVVVDNPTPEDTLYVADSAGGVNSTIQFSIDNGTSYAAADELTYEFTRFSGEKETRKARPEMYTDVRWVVENVGAGEQGELFFQVKVN